MTVKENSFFPRPELISTVDTGDIKSDIYVRFWGLGYLFSKNIESELSNLALTIAQFLVIYVLYFKLDKTTPAVITKRTALKKHTVSRVISELEDSDIVKRAIHPKDRRTILVSLTAKGKVLASKMMVMHRARSHKTLSVLSEDELHALDNTLKKIRYHALFGENAAQ